MKINYKLDKDKYWKLGTFIESNGGIYGTVTLLDENNNSITIGANQTKMLINIKKYENNK